MEKIYDNVRVNETLDWDVVQYAKQIMDEDKPLLIAFHRHGKKEVKHWHIVGVMRAGADHQAAAKDHPGKVGGKKPVQKKSQLYDKGAFDYVLKPKEYAHPDCVVYTNLSAEEIDAAAARSKEYHEKLKVDLPTLLEGIDPMEGEEPVGFHRRVLGKAFDHLMAEEKTPGPWLTHQVRAAVYKKGKRFHPYILSKYE